MENTLDILLQYTKRNKIKLKGYLKSDVEEQNYKALVYVIYAINNFGNNAKLRKKIKNLVSKRSANKNDIKRNYHNQLAEFHALYILTKRMGYNFVDFDVESNKTYANANTNCDLLIEKDGHKSFVEVKDCSGEIISTYSDGNYEHFTPMIPEVLGQWIKLQIKKADKKGADFLVIRVPVWLNEHSSNLTELIDKFFGEISKDIHQKNGKYYWNIKETKITKLILVHDRNLYGVIEVIK
ncbi:MAG: hypothetical protein U9R01_05435 [candidate division WOR-3 bacterium]|nr:hypothetical protein [candidate division WOR-3 bacterium]